MGDQGFIWDRRFSFFPFTVTQGGDFPTTIAATSRRYRLCFVFLIGDWDGGRALRLPRCVILCPCFWTISGFLFAGLIVGLVLGALWVGLHVNHMITQTLDSLNCHLCKKKKKNRKIIRKRSFIYL